VFTLTGCETAGANVGISTIERSEVEQAESASDVHSIAVMWLRRIMVSKKFMAR
jgi:hypothetical protein